MCQRNRSPTAWAMPLLLMLGDRACLYFMLSCCCFRLSIANIEALKEASLKNPKRTLSFITSASSQVHKLVKFSLQTMKPQLQRWTLRNHVESSSRHGIALSLADHHCFCRKLFVLLSNSFQPLHSLQSSHLLSLFSDFFRLRRFSVLTTAMACRPRPGSKERLKAPGKFQHRYGRYGLLQLYETGIQKPIKQRTRKPRKSHQLGPLKLSKENLLATQHFEVKGTKSQVSCETFQYNLTDSKGTTAMISVLNANQKGTLAIQTQVYIKKNKKNE